MAATRIWSVFLSLVAAVGVEMAWNGFMPVLTGGFYCSPFNYFGKHFSLSEIRPGNANSEPVLVHPSDAALFWLYWPITWFTRRPSQGRSRANRRGWRFRWLHHDPVPVPPLSIWYRVSTSLGWSHQRPQRWEAVWITQIACLYV